MRVCFLSTVDFTRMTAASVYCDFLRKNNIAFDFIYVDRKKEQSDNPYGAEQSYGFIPKSEIHWNIITKLIVGYIPFRKYALEIMIKNHYDFIVVWNELTAFLFSDILSQKFSNKYCINIRDYQLFDNKIVRKRIDNAIVNSYFSTISSPDYRQFFDHENVYLLYGTKLSGIDDIRRSSLKDDQTPLNILYIGQIGFRDYVYKLIDELGNDNRFRLIFAGEGSKDIKDYAELKGINNIECYGRFQPEETISYLKKADILYNLYGVDSKHLTMAISLKYYYALYMKIPIMVFENTAMDKMAQEAKIGYAVKPDGFDGLADDLFLWYHRQSFDEISNACETMCKKIDHIQRTITNQLYSILGSDK